MSRNQVVALAFVGSLAVAGPAGAVSVTLAWNQDDGVDGYRLYYGTDLLDDGGPAYDGTNADQGPSPIEVPVSSLADPTNPELEISGLSSCSYVYFALTAYDTLDGGGILESTFSNQIGLTVVQRPLELTATPISDGLTLGWDPLPADDDGYIPTFAVHYGTQQQPDGGQPIDGAGADQGASPVSVDASTLDQNAPSFDLTGLVGGTTYFVSVASVCDDGTIEVSAVTSAATGVVDAGPPGTTGFTGTNGSTGTFGSTNEGSSSSTTSAISTSTSTTGSSSSGVVTSGPGSSGTTGTQSGPAATTGSTSGGATGSNNTASSSGGDNAASSGGATGNTTSGTAGGSNGDSSGSTGGTQGSHSTSAAAGSSSGGSHSPSSSSGTMTTGGLGTSFFTTASSTGGNGTAKSGGCSSGPEGGTSPAGLFLGLLALGLGRRKRAIQVASR